MIKLIVAGLLVSIVGYAATDKKLYTTDLVLKEPSPGANTVTLKPPASFTSNWSFTMPSSSGSAGQVLSTDGSGVMSWIVPVSVSGGGIGGTGTTTYLPKFISGSILGDSPLYVSGTDVVADTGRLLLLNPTTASHPVTLNYLLSYTPSAVSGGTGITGYATGDMLYASSTTALSKRAIGSADQVLQVVGGVPSWTSPGLISFPEPTTASGAATKNYVDNALLPSLVSGGNTGASMTINWASGPTQQVTATDNVTFFFNNPVAGQLYLLQIRQDGTGARTYTWPGTVSWPAGSAPTGSAANKVDIMSFFYDGVRYYGNSSLNY